MEKLTKEKWLEMNGFSPFGITYLVIGNSYAIKNELKENGYVYSPLLRWHSPDKGNITLPKDCSIRETTFEEFFTWDEEQGVVFMKNGTREKLADIFNPIEKTNSEFVGEIGDRIHRVPMIVKNISGFDSEYGYKYVYIFLDEQENIYSWFTTSSQPITIGQPVLLTGTIKGHVVYRGNKNTQLLRCKIEHPHLA